MLDLSTKVKKNLLWSIVQMWVPVHNSCQKVWTVPAIIARGEAPLELEAS
jgi:hypothetical protein